MIFGAITGLFRLPLWLVVGSFSDRSWWTGLGLLAIQLLVIGQIFRAWLGPLVLRTISKRVRVRRISFRSIRGLYMRLATMTIRIDRVGLSYHPSAEATRRFSFKVEGLFMEIHELKARSPSRRNVSRRFSRLPTLSDFAPSPMARRLWSIYSAVYAFLEPYARPAIRSFFVTSIRVIIRCLPVLTQVVDFEMDRALFTLTGFPEAHIAIRGITLSTTVAFSDVESVVGISGESSHTRRHQRFLSMSHLQNRFTRSVKRVLGRAWGGTRGTASFSLRVQNVSGYANVEKWVHLNPGAEDSSRHAGASQFAFVTHSSHDNDMFFDLQDSAELSVAFEFGPTKRIIEDHSILSSLTIPAVQLSMESLQNFIKAIQSTRPTPDRQSGGQSKMGSTLSTNSPESRPSYPLSSKALLFRSVQCSFRDISMRHVIHSKDFVHPRYFTGHIGNLSAFFEFGEPEKSNLHREFLGNCPERTPNLDAEIFSFSFIAKGMGVQRRNAVESSPPTRMISISTVSLQGFASQVTLLRMPIAPIFRGDPNSALLVIKLTVLAPQLSESVDVVTDVLEHLQQSGRVSPVNHKSLGIVHHMPRLFVDIVVDDVAACLSPIKRDGISSSSLILSSTQCVMTMSTSFKFFPLSKSSLPELDQSGSIPLELEFTLQSLLGPAFVMVLPEPFTLGVSTEDSRTSDGSFRFGGDPLLSLSAIEFIASGQTLGVMFDNTDKVVLDLTSTMTDVKCVTDAISVELWQPSALFSLKSLLDSVRDLTKHRSDVGHGFLPRLPGGVTAHLAVGQVGIIVTGKDINPDEDLGISRGIAVRSGFTLHYCSLHDRGYFARIPKRFIHSNDRQRLYLPDDLLLDAISFSSSSTSASRKFALFRSILWDTTFRTSVATEFAADQAYEARELPNELRSAEFLWIRRAEINALSRYHGTSEDQTELTEHLQLSVGVPNIQSCVQLFEIYCALLALGTLRSFSNTQRENEQRDKELQHSKDMSVALKATFTTAQVLVKMPLQEQVCLRINGLVLHGYGSGNATVEWGTFFAWVPSIRDEGKWTELTRLHSWKVRCYKAGSTEFAFFVEGKGARLRIPYGYIMADLILDINLAVKCIKHLFKVVFSGRYSPMSPPIAEKAMSIPTINVNVGCLSLEASDDPLESKLGLVWRAGSEAARSRIEREEAFDEKAAAIREAEAEQLNQNGSDKRFTPHHTIPIDEARERLLLVHSLSWASLHREYCDVQRRNELNLRREIRGDHFYISGADVEPLVPLVPSSKSPPLLRFIATHLKIHISKPEFTTGDLSDFLYDLGNSLPRDTEFSLLLPLHLSISLGSSCVTLRDYPLPLLNIVQESAKQKVAWAIETDLVVAEEMGTVKSVVWKDLPVVIPGSGSAGSKPLYVSVPKTIMPVKTYANPTVNVLTSQLTEFCWGNSYAAALQDVMRILDTLTTPPPDSSPTIGFWDKMRLALHWRAEINFASDVHLNLKGSRDPYATDGEGAGFAFCWNGNTRMSVCQPNTDNELLQVYSDRMLIVIPYFRKRMSDEVIGDGISTRFARGPVSLNQGLDGSRKSFKKICAKFSSGIKWGIGIVLERTCERSCTSCKGSLACRLFDFRPHHGLKLELKSVRPLENTPEDSFNGFRSDFIHLSTSLSSSIKRKDSSTKLDSSSFHLTPKTFAHFWSWWELFDRSLSIPVRQGNLFPNARPPSKKFSRHLATIKYRLAIQRLFISHAYLDDSRESWSDGVTHCVGVKALVNSFEADMHQREQEVIVPGIVPNTIKKIRHKPFYAAEVKLVDLHLCAVLATFIDPSKRLLNGPDFPRESPLKDVTSDDANGVLHNFWFDIDDFVETDWKPTEDSPPCHMLSIASCPRFTYFKRSSGQPQHDSEKRAIESSRFGAEETHVCIIGKEQSVQHQQSEIVAGRLAELQQHLTSLQRSASLGHTPNGLLDFDSEARATEKKVRQLERHIIQLREADSPISPSPEQTGEYAKYLMPSDISFPVDWTEFDNVYQAHCPKFSLNNSSRDILTQYYYCSRARRGLEYHMAARAVKYIRDQVDAYSRSSSDVDNAKRTRNPTGLAAQVASQALRKILVGIENESEGDARASGADEADKVNHFDPMDGWSKEDVTQNKSHFCLLLKPQVVLRCEETRNSVIVLAALQATLQSHAILDTANIDDPISGRIMTRTHAMLSGLQTFSPSPTCHSRHEGVPLEVLIDLRAESSDFDRVVPQTDATFRYDKFNRLRLRNNVSSAVSNSQDKANSHLQHQTDLVDVHIPQFTVSANSKNFEAIANVITNLLLHSDSVYKLRLSKIETLLFSYDFTDLSAAADVVEDLQSRLRRAAEHEHDLETMSLDDDESQRSELMKLKANIFLLSEELNLIFDAIKLAQEKADDKHDDTKMALKVHASARDISWKMMDDAGEMIAKLAVRGIDFSWLSRQDSSTVNKLVLVDLQAFDGSPDAEWPEILSKYREPSNHPLVKRGIFIQADWTVLAPVGGITIYEQFELDLHPMRLQLEARVGKSIMEYVWPARRERTRLGHLPQSSNEYQPVLQYPTAQSSTPVPEHRASADITSLPHERKRYSIEERRPAIGLTARRISSSRSFTDLRSASRQNSTSYFESSETPDFRLVNRIGSGFPFNDSDQRRGESIPLDLPAQKQNRDDAAEMKTRSAQKTFVLVRICSMHILLSFHKDGSFFCRDARIHTRELQYRNQTWSFEELADQFIPTDTSWRGWMRMALHQPLVPVLPVARELFSKTKWIASKGKSTRQIRKVTKPKPTSETDTPRNGASGSRVPPSDSPRSRKLRRPRRSIDEHEIE